MINNEPSRYTGPTTAAAEEQVQAEIDAEAKEDRKKSAATDDSDQEKKTTARRKSGS